MSDESRLLLHNKKNNILTLCVFIIALCIYTLAGSNYILSNKNEPTGEYDSYMLPTISIVRHGSMIITEEDVEQAAIDFPEFYTVLKSRFDSGRMVSTKDGSGVNPFYYCTYSLMCIPLKLLLKWIGVSQSWTFPFTNLFMILSLCIFIYIKMREDNLKKLILTGFILVNPIFAYLRWQSAEVCIFCLVVLSILHFCYSEYKRSAFFLSLAGTLNVTVMFFGFVLIADYFLKLFKERERGIWNTVKKNICSIIQFGCCFLIVFLPFIHNYINVGTVNSTFAMAANEGIFSRFIAYLFDLNFGIFVYYPILFFVLVFVLVCSVKNRNYRPWLLLTAMLGVVFAYSLAKHINCGMSGISRYGSWTTPFLIFICVMYFPYDSLKRKIPAGCLLGCTALILFHVISLSMQLGYVYMTYPAYLVLEYAPQLYNPLFSTFYARTAHLSGGYDYADNLPVIYSSLMNGKIKKVLVDNENASVLFDLLALDEAEAEYISNVISDYETDQDPYYINIPGEYDIYYSEDALWGLEVSEEELILDVSVDESSSGTVVCSAMADLESDTYYKILVQYKSDSRLNSYLICDFYGGSGYDSGEQETELCVYSNEGDIYSAEAVLYSGDISTAGQDIVVRILDYVGNTSFEIETIQVYELTVSE